MPVPTEQQIHDALKQVKYPGFSRDIISFGLVKGVSINDGRVGLRMSVTTNDKAVSDQLRQEADAALRKLEGVTGTDIVIETQSPVTSAMQAGSTDSAKQRIDGVRHVIAVASGKGGVGKSTVAANLACALQLEGASVGLCDCDIYGPSVAMMFGGDDERPYATEDNRIIPIERHGIQLMSMGFLLTDNSPAILRGPMVTRYTQQFLRMVVWDNKGPLDFLILDLPPGTGDIQLTIVQTVALTGAVIVTTPQEVALIDARKASTMFEKVDVEVMGLIENMSYFLCPNDGNKYEIFGSGGGRKEADRLGIPLLAQVPLEMPVRASGDEGTPIVVARPEAEAAQAFRKAAGTVFNIAQGH